MFAAIPLAFKIGGPIVLVGIILGGWYLYKDSIRDQGRDEIRMEQAKEREEQAEHVKVYEEAQDTSRIEDLEKQIAETKKFNAAILKTQNAKEREVRQLKEKLASASSAEPEVIHDVEYVEVEKEVEKLIPCVVPDDLVDRVDHLASVLNAIPYHSVPISGEAAGEPALQGSGPVACLALVARIEALTSRLGNILIPYRKLSERAVKQYELYEAWKRSVQGE